MSHKLRLVVLGMMGRCPFGGQSWLYLNWLRGLHRLGHVGDGQARELGPVGAVDAQRHAQRQHHAGEHRQPDPHREHAEGERRKSGDAELHHRPVEAPGQREGGEKQELASAEREGGGRGFQCGPR